MIDIKTPSSSVWADTNYERTDFVHEDDKEARLYAVNYVFPILGIDAVPSIDGMSKIDCHGKDMVEIKTRHNAITKYRTTDVEERKWNEMKDEKAGLLVFLKDVIVYYTHEQLLMNFKGLSNPRLSPDQNPYTGKWEKVMKVYAMFGYNDNCTKIPYKDGIVPQFVLRDPNKQHKAN